MADAPAPRRAPASWTPVAVLVVAVALLAAAGVAVGQAAVPVPPKGLEGCRPAARLAARVYKAPPPLCIDTRAHYVATITTTRGDITLTLLAGQAPNTVNNFIVLALDGYYNGLSFFNDGTWYVQGGDPLENGRGGPGYTLPDEGSNEHWAPGFLGMARGPDGVNGGQLLVLKSDWPEPGPQGAFNHFATVTLGADVANQLTSGDRIVKVAVRKG